jgi:predicted esterase
MFLHGSGNDESSYLDQNNKQMIKLANEHGYLLVSPLGDKGAYGNFLRLSAPFGNAKAAADLMAQVTSASELTNQLSEKDVINVLELVLQEYPIDSSALFLTGHSMGSGGTWYIGGKYRSYWKGLAPMSGPFVQETGYPWDSLHTMNFFVTEGTQAPSLDGSRTLRDWMKNKNFNIKYKEVNADHGGMVPLVLPDVFSFFDSCRNSPVAISSKQTSLQKRYSNQYSVNYLPSQSLHIKFSSINPQLNSVVTVLDIAGRIHYNRAVSTAGSDLFINNLLLSAGTYQALIRTGSQIACVDFIVVK